MTEKYIPASKLEALPRFSPFKIGPSMGMTEMDNGQYVNIEDLSALIEAAPEVSSEPVAIYEQDTNHLQELMDTDMAKGWRWMRKDFAYGDKLYTAPQDQTALIRELVDALDEHKTRLPKEIEAYLLLELPAKAQLLYGIYRKNAELLTLAKEAIK